MFEIATRNKYRFSSSRGSLTVEDLWMLPLKTGEVNLNTIALQLDKDMQQVSKSFVDEVTAENQTLKNKFDIILHIINMKKEEQKAKEQLEANKSKLALLKAIQELEKQSQQ